MNYLAFSLYGSIPKYCVGAVRNAELMPHVYPGWKMIVFHGDDVPGDTIAALNRLGALTQHGPTLKLPNRMMWRFTVCNRPDAEYWGVRDCDSRINPREKALTDEWIERGHGFCVGRDHPHHTRPVMGCLFNGKRDVVNMVKLIRSTGPWTDDYDQDQQFLARVVWPRVQADCWQRDLCHHQQFGAHPWPARLGDWRFCGEVFDENETPRAWDWMQRLNWMTA